MKYPTQSGTAHFGSRILIHDEYLFMTIGDRGDKDFSENHLSQDTTNVFGSIIRLYLNGSVPFDNPFVDNNSVLDEIYTFGHRNPQGIAINRFTQEIWISDHGEQDGDEINILQAGGNYGWPLYHYGCTYVMGRPIGGFAHENPKILNPIYHWDCGSGGFPPAGMTFYDGDIFSDWIDDLFIGNLRHRYLGHFRVENRVITEQNPLLSQKNQRIRDVKQSPDGYLYVLTDVNHGFLYKISPIE